MDAKRDIQISKALSYLLRHGAQKEKLVIDNNGYIPIDTILQHNRLKTHKCSRQDLIRVVNNNDKKRFIIDEEKDMIAATQGHSIELKPDDTILIPIKDSDSLPSKLIHGTNVRNCLAIVESGKISKMRRNHIHLSIGIVGKDTNVISGMRKTSSVYIYIKKDPETLSQLKLFKSLNDVYLCENDINISCFEKIEIKNKKQLNDDQDTAKLVQLLKDKNVPYEMI
ncbi:similar to Saccharomyces cerevisiae YOL102C TPT1 tRNA 2'-phosphotransferase [Maudiozyma saulgeensis]|uniref:2'-phosphotransferase n=1 Tax=Maudiozyma saulgeensis TaxID=1789683 RepID=A0A1X7R9I4_9SACH|nr:similar to Saccharomyces cerevisiae YOL102C TPT1 tRNA 2'-phosphotransferase [Kazachstania saulgeensis]